MNKTILKSPGQKDEYALFPLRYDWAWNQYLLMRANFWTAQEVGISSDLSHWHGDALSEPEKHLFLTVFAQVTTFDILRTADIVQDFVPLVHAPEIFHALTTQAFQECLHTESYQYVIESIGLPQDDIYTRYKSVPQIANRVQLTEQIGGLNQDSSPKQIFRALVHTYLMFEHVWFRVNLLGPVQSLARRRLMTGTAEQFQYIMRDEDTHVALGVYLLRDFIKEHPEVVEEDNVTQIIEDTKLGLKLEEDFIRYALPTPILGYNANDHISQARYYASVGLRRIGIDIDFKGRVTIPWIDEMVATWKEKNFFETRVIEYQVGNLSFDDVNSDMPTSVMDE